MSTSKPRVSTPQPQPSPCINVCRMDDDTGWCGGCLRTLDEIAAWGTLPDATRAAVWVALGQRRVRWVQLGRGPLPAPQPAQDGPQTPAR